MLHMMEEKLGFALAVEKEIKVRENSRVLLVRDMESNQRYIFRVFTGNDRVYRKLLSVSCPYLPKIYAVEASGDSVCALEEYVQGDTLADILENGNLTEQQTERILLQLCFALMQLHGSGIVHRDIKPENVILRGDQAVLIDFNASRLETPGNTTDTRIMGTTGYAAPEQYGFAQTDERADIYALGVLTNEMRTRSHPSGKLAEGRLRPIIERCIEVNVDKRYGSVGELVMALCEKSDVPVLAEKKPGRRLWAGAAAAAAVCGLLAAVWLLPKEEPREQHQEQVPVQDVTGTQPREETRAQIAVDVFMEEEVAVPDEPWAGEVAGHHTFFAADMDGDGVGEDYIFGLEFDGIPVNGILSDTTGLASGETIGRRVFPCVWKQNPDGSVGEEAAEFAALLTNPEVTLWRVDNLDSPAPKVTTTGGNWKGGLQIYVDGDANLGTWLYEVKAELNGQQMTAVSVSRFARYGT